MRIKRERRTLSLPGRRNVFLEGKEKGGGFTSYQKEISEKRPTPKKPKNPPKNKKTKKKKQRKKPPPKKKKGISLSQLTLMYGH